MMLNAIDKQNREGGGAPVSHGTLPQWWQSNAKNLFDVLLSPSFEIAPEFRKLISSALIRGRLLRGSLALQMPVWLTGTNSGIDRDLLIRLLAQVELVHSAACILDDVIDQDTCRRGVPTFQERSGLPAAILTAMHMISRACDEEIRLLSEDRRRLAKAYDRMILGEAYDVITGLTRDGSPSTGFSRVLEKTTPLFGAAFWYAGLAVDHAGSDIANKSSIFGERLGAAYQMANDFHDIFSIGPLVRGNSHDRIVISWSMPVYCATTLGLFDPEEVGRCLTREQLQNIYEDWRMLGVEAKAKEELSAAKEACLAAFPAPIPAQLRNVVELIVSESFWSYSYEQ